MQTNTARSKLIAYLNTALPIGPLATFRLGFGGLMVFALLRFWYNGWIEKLYLEPDFHFHYQGFHWVTVPPPALTYGLFILCGLAALGIALGLFYRLSALVFFLSFTYIELMDKTTYLNHYYFVSLVAFLLIFLPASRFFSLDVRRKPALARDKVPRYVIGALRVLVGIVYVYAGLAKLNTDWLLAAMPLKIWLASKHHLPIIGGWLAEEWVQYAFSWAGALFDLGVVFFLLWSPTRWLAYLAVIIFHVLTWILFPIGIFPFVMILAATVFFPAYWHQRMLLRLTRLLKIKTSQVQLPSWQPTYPRFFQAVLLLFLSCQLLFPFRYLTRPGELFWTEDGYRFSWRVMLMEKAGYANFKVVDPDTGHRFYVDNTDFLTAFQEKQMSTQVDFILEYAHFLDAHFRQSGIRDPEIYVESYVALNGRLSRPYVKDDIDLSTFAIYHPPFDLLEEFNDDIHGL
ncbi:MAG: HTTM domain-containing protein [Bacteroidota bacterium]